MSLAAEDVTNIVELVARFRKPNANESLEDIAKRAWGVLQLQGEPSLTSFEAFLIEAISLHVSSKSGEEGTLTRDEARKRDLALLAFGLLEDYYHTEHRSDGEHYVPVDERRMTYLRASDYLELNYPGKYSKDDISKGRRFAPWGTITQSDSRCQRELAKYLTALDKRNSCTKVMQTGIEKHTRLVTLPNGSTVRQIILPKPCFTKENFPPQNLTKTNTTSSSPLSQKLAKNKPKGKQQTGRQETRLVAARASMICLAACVAIIILAAGLYQYFTQRSNVIQHISVSNSSVVLSPGEYTPLYISVYTEDPELDPDWDALQCRSNDAPLITTAKASDWAESRTWTTAWSVLAARDWAADLPYSGSITVDGGKAEAVTVPVTVVDAADSSHETYLPEPPERVDSGDAITP